MGSRSTRSASIATQGAPFAAPSGKLGEKAAGGPRGDNGLRDDKRRPCCISTLRATTYHPRESWDPAVGHDEATPMPGSRRERPKAASLIASWAFAIRVRQHNRPRKHLRDPSRSGPTTRGIPSRRAQIRIAPYSLLLHRRTGCGKMFADRSVAQLVEHRSPKPGAGGSSPLLSCHHIRLIFLHNLNCDQIGRRSGCYGIATQSPLDAAFRGRFSPKHQRGRRRLLASLASRANRGPLQCRPLSGQVAHLRPSDVLPRQASGSRERGGGRGTVGGASSSCGSGEPIRECCTSAAFPSVRLARDKSFVGMADAKLQELGRPLELMRPKFLDDAGFVTLDRLPRAHRLGKRAHAR